MPASPVTIDPLQIQPEPIPAGKQRLSGIDPAPDATVLDQAKERLVVAELAPVFLEWQCRMIAGVMRGAMFLVSPDGELSDVVSEWPKDCEPSTLLERTANQTLASANSELASQVQYSEHRGRICDALAVPIAHEGQVVAVISLALAGRALPQQKAVMQLVEWGASWFKTVLQRESAGRNQRASQLVQLFESGLAAENLNGLAKVAVKTLADSGPCLRVSAVVSTGNRTKLLAVSGIESFDSRSRFATRFEEAAEEAFDQERAIGYPQLPGDVNSICRAHKRLSDANPNHSFFTTVSTHRSMRFALIVEADKDSGFTQAQTELYKDATRLLGQAASLIHAADGSIGGFLRNHRTAEKKSRTRKLAIWLVGIAAVVGLASIIPVTNKVTAPVELVSQEQRAVVAAVAGFIRSSTVRPGDRVEKGDVLAELDTTALELEVDKWNGLRGARQAEYQEALATRNRIQISVLRAQLAQIDAELALVNAHIERSVMRAPYAGLVISGDLSQVMNAPVEQGQQLFKIAALDGYRLSIEVSEYDIAALSGTEVGKLRLAALPHQSLPFKIERVMPVAVSGDGQSHFRIEGRLMEVPVELRPGMRGVAKITTEERSLLWNVTHSTVSRLRLLLWSFGV